MKRVLLLTSTLFTSLTCRNYQKSRPAENAPATERVQTAESSNKEESTSNNFDKIKKRNNKMKACEQAFRNFMSKCVSVAPPKKFPPIYFIEGRGDIYPCYTTIIEPISAGNSYCKQLFREAMEQDEEFAMRELMRPQGRDIDEDTFIHKYTNSSKDDAEDPENYISNLLIDYLTEEYHKNKRGDHNDFILKQILTTILKFSSRNGNVYILMDLVIVEQSKQFITLICSDGYRNFVDSIISLIVNRYKTLLKQNDHIKSECYEKFILLAHERKIDLKKYAQELTFIQALIVS